MATCYKCGGFKPDNGLCPTCAKIESDRQIAEEQRHANEYLARRNLEAQAEIASIMAADAQKKHNELMEQEAIRLQELKKQTQILLEHGLTEDEVYQKGLNFVERPAPSLFEEDDHEVILKLNDRGDIFAEYDNPYVQKKFRQAYEKGVQDRLNRDYSKGAGIEFMSEEAFNIGYKVNTLDDARSNRANIYFPNKKSPRFYYRAPNYPSPSFSVNEADGSLVCYWNDPYDSEILNDSFAAGVEKYLKEQNTAAKKKARLADIEQEQAKQQAIKAANDKAAAEKAEKEASEAFWRSIVNAILGAFAGAAAGAIFAIPIYFFLSMLLIFFGGMSWTFWGFVKGMALFSAFIGLLVGKNS